MLCIRARNNISLMMCVERNECDDDDDDDDVVVYMYVEINAGSN